MVVVCAARSLRWADHRVEEGRRYTEDDFNWVLETEARDKYRVSRQASVAMAQIRLLCCPTRS